MTINRVLFSKCVLAVSIAVFTTSSVSAVTSYDGTPPTAPTNIKATAYTSSPTRVVVTWNQAQDNIGVTRYNIYKNGTFWISPLGVGVTYTDFDVAPGQTYTYAIQAGDGDGNNGPQSELIQILVGEGSVSRVVTASSGDVSTTANTTTYTQQVSSVYDSASLKADTVQVNHPESVGMIAYDNHFVISWKNPQGNQFKSVRVIKKDTSFPVSTTDGKVICDSLLVTQCTDKDVVPGKVYYYGVYAVDKTYLTSKLILVSGTLPEKKQVVMQSQNNSQPAGIAQTIANPNAKPQGASVEKLVSFTKVLKVGSTGQEVLSLQKFLNTKGFVIAQTGPGSQGNETMTFGRATQTAVQKYQCSKKIVCDGTPNSTGYGMVGKTTRLNLNKDSQ